MAAQEEVSDHSEVLHAGQIFDDYSMDEDLNGSAIWGIVCDGPAADDIDNASRLLRSPPPSSSVMMTSSRANEFRFFVDVYVVSVVCLFGFLGNALTIAVLKWDADRANPTSWLLQSLALVDSSYLVTCLFIQPIKTMHELTDRMAAFREPFLLMEPYMWALAAVAQTATVWMILLVTIDRYVAVCKPFKSKLRSLSHAKVSVVVVFASALLYNIPLFFERHVVYVRNDCTGHVTAELRKSRFTTTMLYFIIYKTLCYFLFRTFGPLLLLTFLNHRLIVSLKTMKKRHDRMGKSSTRQKENITLMLVVVISVFIVCELPDVCLRVTVTASELVPDRIVLDHALVHGANSLVNMLLTVNSAVNFIIYCLVGKKFRRILARRLCFGARARDGADASLALGAETGVGGAPSAPDMVSTTDRTAVVSTHIVSTLQRGKEMAL